MFWGPGACLSQDAACPLLSLPGGMGPGGIQKHPLFPSQVQSKKAMDTYLSEYEKFYLEQMARDVSEYAATLSGAASPGQGT